MHDSEKKDLEHQLTALQEKLEEFKPPLEAKDDKLASEMNTFPSTALSTKFNEVVAAGAWSEQDQAKGQALMEELLEEWVRAEATERVNNKPRLEQ